MSKIDWTHAPAPKQVATGLRGALKGGNPTITFYNAELTPDARKAAYAMANGWATKEEREFVHAWAFGIYLKTGDRHQHALIFDTLQLLEP